MNRRKLFKKNIVYSAITQIIIIALGFFVPRLVLVSYGSEANGLLNTVVQIFAYVALLEAGIGNASINALYKPIAANNEKGVAAILNATKKYFRKVTKIYALCVVLISVIYPLIVKSDLSKITVALVILFQGMSGVVTFYYAASYKQLLIADGKNYIVQNIYLLIYILTSGAKIVLMYMGYNIVALQVSYFIISCIQVMIYSRIMRKKYGWVFAFKEEDMSSLSQKNAFLIHEISATIFSSTDVFVLSIFCNFKIASVYAIYNMVFNSLNTFINAINTSLIYILGQKYAKDKDGYTVIHDIYDSIYVALVFSIFSVAYLLIIPFVRLYTGGIVDINYIDYKLPILFVLIQLMSSGRAVSARLITIAGHAANTQNRSIAEAIINLSVSLVLVNFIGIYGVLVGTIVALLYRMNDIIIYANTKILHRKPVKTYSIFGINVTIFLIIVGFNTKLHLLIENCCTSYIVFFVLGVLFSMASGLIYFGVAFIINRKIVKQFLAKKMSR